MQIVISRSDKPDKKFEARIDGKKSIHFGSRGMSDFTKPVFNKTWEIELN